MGQALIESADHTAVARFLESLCPADVLNLAPGRQRYTQLLNESGGIVDDLMVTRPPGADGALRLVVNASRKEIDFALIRERLPAGVRLTPLPEASLIALQGPLAAATLARLAPQEPIETMAFMSARPARIAGFETFVSRSGYTGEDGYEISIASAQAEGFARVLLDEPDVAPIGLGARDSLRLEAGLCLYGHELDETTDPIEAALSWSIQKRRRLEGGFPGAKRIQNALANGPDRQRVGLRPDGRAPAREGAEIVSAGGAPIGLVTSGGFAPSLNAPIAMGYVARAHAAIGTPVALMVRGKALSARVVALPFHPHAYYRG
jgi:aminomethyltransferase